MKSNEFSFDFFIVFKVELFFCYQNLLKVLRYVQEKNKYIKLFCTTSSVSYSVNQRSSLVVRHSILSVYRLKQRYFLVIMNLITDGFKVGS